MAVLRDIYKTHLDPRIGKYLTWVQNSALEGEITEAKFEKLKLELKKVIKGLYRPDGKMISCRFSHEATHQFHIDFK